MRPAPAFGSPEIELTLSEVIIPLCAYRVSIVPTVAYKSSISALLTERIPVLLTMLPTLSVPSNVETPV